MNGTNALFNALGIDGKQAVTAFCKASDVPADRLRYYNNTNTLPSGNDLDRVCGAAGISKVALMLKMGIMDHNIISAIQKHSDAIYEIINNSQPKEVGNKKAPKLAYETGLGKLYRGDCLDLMRQLESESVDFVFADPPFNLKKLYPSKIDDNLKEEQYLRWCESWVEECVRLLKPGGSFFLWSLPKWNTSLSAFLNNRLTFRHWISVDIKYSLPIPKRLYPSHYALLYYCKGEKPNTFKPDRFPMPVCPHCAGDLKDYGGYKDKMNPKGVNMSDVWTDIPPVRHAKYKRRNGANELSIKLLDRLIELGTKKGDLVFDPFGGSGTTYAVAEIKKRKWIGIELGPVDEIIERFKRIAEEAQYIANIREDYNCLFTDQTLALRNAKGLWTHETVRKKADIQMQLNGF